MNKLLAFYIPKTTTEILKFFGFTVALSLIFRYFPFVDLPDEGLTKFVLYLVFPVLTYFNRTMYLPASLDWILLTPNKKTDIALAHGLINLYKILFLFILINIFIYIYDGESLILQLYEYIVGKDSIPDSFTRVPAQGVFAIFMFFALIIIFLFGILPNYVQNIQQQQNYRVKKTFKENFKIYSILCGIVLVYGGLVSVADKAVDLIPQFVLFSVFVVGFFCLAIDATLTRLRFYFSKKKIYFTGIGVTVLCSSFFYIYATTDILSDKLHVSDKMESLEFLGMYSQNLDHEIEKDLIASKSVLSQLTGRDLKRFFQDDSRKEMATRVFTNWEALCNQKSDFTCRLAFHILMTPEEKTIAFKQVLKACPNDLGSCSIVFERKGKDVPLGEQEKAIVGLTLGCKEPKNNYELNICNDFTKKMKASKKK